MNIQIRSAVLAVVVGLIPSVGAAAEGKVLLAIGDSFAESKAGAKRRLDRGTVISEGDTLVTERGRMQVRMIDGAFIALQPNTRFQIESYRHQPQSAASDSAFMRLLRGGIRSITGAIGKSQRSSYRLTTKVATIGIRGTTFKLLYCDGDCADLPNGLYASGGEGTISVTNGAGELILGAGQNAYVASADVAPVLTSVDPVVADIAQSSSDAESIAEDATKLEFIAGEAVFQGSTSGISAVIPLRQGAVAYNGSVVFDDVAEQGIGLASAIRGTDLTELNAAVNAEGGIIGIAGTDTNGDSGAIFLTGVANAATDGQLYLGRWTSATATAFTSGGFGETVELDAGDSVHFVVGVNEAFVPSNGTATYAFSGMATPSTDSAGRIGGGITSGDISVNFGTQEVAANLQIAHDGNYAVSTSGFLGFAKPENFSTSGFASGPACSGSCAASIDGFLSGNAGSFPARVGAAYEIQTGDRAGITGVGGFNLQ